jgi:hypothetical protein
MHGKIALEEHFAIAAPLADSQVFGAHMSDELAFAPSGAARHAAGVSRLPGDAIGQSAAQDCRYPTAARAAVGTSGARTTFDPDDGFSSENTRSAAAIVSGRWATATRVILS